MPKQSHLQVTSFSCSSLCFYYGEATKNKRKSEKNCVFFLKIFPFSLWSSIIIPLGGDLKITSEGLGWG